MADAGGRKVSETRASRWTVGSSLLGLLAMAGLIGCAVAAGICIAFYGFVLPGLRFTDPAVGLAALKQIHDTTTLGTWLPRGFAETAWATLGLSVAVFFQPQKRLIPFALAGAALVAGAIYINVNYIDPVNATLAQPVTDATAQWHAYFNDFDFWNRMRLYLIAAAGVPFLHVMHQAMIAQDRDEREKA